MNRNLSSPVGAYVWTTIGSICNAISSFVYLVAVTRTSGKATAGLFALGFANAQLMLTLGKFGMRSFQSTDIGHAISSMAYLVSRVLSCSLMMVASLAFCLAMGYSAPKTAVVMGVCFLKAVDALEDVFHGLYQRNGLMRKAGINLTIRNFFTVLSFILVILVSGDCLCASVVSGILSVFVCLAINHSSIRLLADEGRSRLTLELSRLLSACFPLFLGSFLSLLIYNIPKYAIDRRLSYDFQAVYSMIFMPAFLTSLFSEFAFRPALLTIAQRWSSGGIKAITGIVTVILLSVALAGVAILLLCHFYAVGFLSLVYGVDLNRFSGELEILIIGGIFGALGWALNNLLIAIRHQRLLLLGYVVTAAIIAPLSTILVSRLGLTGATVSYALSAVLLFGFFFSIFLVAARRDAVQRNLTI